MARRICVFTGSRAEYGLLKPLMREIQQDNALQLQLVVSGSHLSGAFGETVREIEADGLPIDAKVDMQLTSDRPVDLTRSMALCLAGCATVFERVKPDIVTVLGDRYEALAAAEAAMMLRIPIAHIHGGETTEGAIDDAIRHAITKLAHLHFAAAEPYRQRIIRLGEQPHRVFTVGAPGLDEIAAIKLMKRRELEEDLGFRFAKRNLLVTFHPATLDLEGPAAAVSNLTNALDRFPDVGLVVTKATADAGGSEVNRMMEAYAQARPGRVLLTTSLGQRRYLSVMAQVDGVVGNSSSGIIEAPVMGKPTVNIGIRQHGRARSPSVIDCSGDADSIFEAIQQALSPHAQSVAARKQSPYKSGASKLIKEVLAATDLNPLLTKTFFDPVAESCCP